MKNYVHKSKYFCGHQISEYGLQNGRIDYGTLAKAFDAVLCNEITKLFYSDINGEYNEVEQVNGFIDNSDEIDELNERLDELNDEYKEAEEGSEREKELEKEIDELSERIEELESEQDEQPEIYQYYIISDAGADLLKDCTNEILYYLPGLDVYVWGVTHYGTSWDYVLTDIKIELDEV